MEKVTVKELRHLVKIGAAEEITECKQITESVKQISYSSGVYGLNGALLRGEKKIKQAIRYHWAYFSLVLLLLNPSYVRFVSCIATLSTKILRL